MNFSIISCCWFDGRAVKSSSLEVDSVKKGSGGEIVGKVVSVVVVVVVGTVVR